MIIKFYKIHPGRIILCSILLAIIMGTILLSLPISRNIYIPFIDLFFTATSSMCVTGLLTIPLNSFTLFGQIIIFSLIQIGGLGLITLSLMLASLFVDLGLGTQTLLGNILEIDNTKKVKEILLFIIKLTALLEIIGALLIFLIIKTDYSITKAIFYSFFHSISSFCNSGFSIFGNSMILFSNNINMLTITILLMIIGGFGFIPLNELITNAKSILDHQKKQKISLNTKMVILMFILLLIIGLFLFWTLEYNNTLKNKNLVLSFFNALFNTISMRGTGFISVPFNELKIATIFLIMIFGFIGASPGSTGGGIKTTVFCIFLITAKAIISGKSSVQIKNRKIASIQVYKAMTTITLSAAWILITTFLLLLTETNVTFLDVLFEATSAFSVLGLSTGITASLSFIGKILIIISMIIGRIGSLTLALALIRKSNSKEFTYPEERVMLS